MRLFAAIATGLALLALLGARYLDEPGWRVALYCLPLFSVAALAGIAAVLLELLLGPAFRAVASGLSLVLALFAVAHALFERAPGTLAAGLPLDHLAANALSVAALGAALSGPVLGWIALRAPQPIARSLGAVAIGGCAYALGKTAGALGAPGVSPYALALAAVGSALWMATGRDDKGARGAPP